MPSEIRDIKLLAKKQNELFNIKNKENFFLMVFDSFFEPFLNNDISNWNYQHPETKSF